MVVVHIGMSLDDCNANAMLFADRDKVLFKFHQDTAQTILDTFARELRKLKHLSCVKDQRLVLGGPSITTPASRSKGFQYCLLSYHQDRAALEEYQASPEHHRCV